MSNRRRAEALVLLASAVCLCAASLQAADEAESSKERIRKLIEQLGTDKFAEREAATKELLSMGSVVSAPLTEALESGRLSAEAAERARRILAQVYVPPSGAVWRGADQRAVVMGDRQMLLGEQQVPEGIPTPVALKEGDIVIQVDGEPVRSAADLERLAGPRLHELTVWRKGQDEFKLAASPSAGLLRGFRTWPDPKTLYEQFGHKGPWDAHVVKALDLAGALDPNAIEHFRSAWKAGCRDALVLASWLSALADAGQRRQALELASGEMASARQGHPDGRYALGLLPDRVAWVQMLSRRRKDAAETLSRAVAKARRKVAIDMRPELVQLALDGRAVRTWYRDEPCPKTAMPTLSVRGCRGEFRNFRAYVRSAAKADNAAIEKALGDLHQAMIAGELKEVRRHNAVLLDAWANVPEAKPFADRTRRIVALYEALFRPEGLRLCTPELLTDPVVHTIGRWELDQPDWLVAGTLPGERWASPRLQLPLITPDIEITGVIQLQDPGKTTEWQILWNCHWTAWWDERCDRGNAFLKYWPPEPKVFVGAYHDRMRVKKLEKSIANGPLALCLRIRGDQVALFLQDGAKPLLRFAGTKRRIYSFNLRAIGVEKDTAVRFGRIVVRYLPKDRKLDAPAELPKITGAAGRGISGQSDL